MPQSFDPQQINTPKLQFSLSPYMIPKQSPFSSPFMGIPPSCYPGQREFYSFKLSDPQSYPREPKDPDEPKSADEFYKSMIEFIVQNIVQPEEAIKREWMRKNHIEEGSLVEAFSILIKKFKKLKKTKEEMTKYCMRKAFKYLSQKMRNDGVMQRGQTEFNLKYYCSQLMGDDYMSIPFRKNSIEKTMNASFLKKIFSSTKFIKDYLQFVEYFNRLAKEDNQKKIVYLAQIVQDAIKQNNMARIESVKRLPWTLPMLIKTEELAFKLLQYRPNHLKEMTDGFLQRRGGVGLEDHIPLHIKYEQNSHQEEHEEVKWHIIENSPAFSFQDI